MCKECSGGNARDSAHSCEKLATPQARLFTKDDATVLSRGQMLRERKHIVSTSVAQPTTASSSDNVVTQKSRTRRRTRVTTEYETGTSTSKISRELYRCALTERSKVPSAECIKSRANCVHFRAKVQGKKGQQTFTRTSRKKH